MAWTTPKTWTTGELVTATDLNTHVRDNLSFLKTKVDAGSNRFKCYIATPYITTTSTSFVDMSTGSLSGTLTTSGNPVLIGASSSWNGDTGTNLYLDVLVDSARLGPLDVGLLTAYIPSGNQYYPFCLLTIRDFAAGNHNFKLQWRVSSGGGRLYASNPISFFAMELM